MIAFVVAILLSFLSPPAMDSDPAPAAVAQEDGWGEVPLLPEEAYYPPADCPVVLASDATDEAWTWLLGQGWTGKAGDGMEGVYPPGC